MRLFIAVELTDEIRAGLGRLQADLRRSYRGWRWVRPESTHLTLRFLGEVDQALDLRSRSAWRAAAAEVGPFRLRVEGLGGFPPAGRPRLLWVGVSEQGPAPERGRLSSLADRFEQAAQGLDFKAETRPFRAHLTLARAARGARAESPATDLCAGPWTLPVTDVALFESRLEPSGARYTRLESFPLAR